MANPQGTNDPQGGRDGQASSDDLAARIARAQGQRQPTRRPIDIGGNQAVAGASRAYRLAAEFVAAIIVGAGLGYGIDLLFGTRPWGMVILLLFGFAAGVLNVVRAAADMNAKTAVPPNTPAQPDDDDDN